jgi:dihydrolipoamide dehydrogenase
MIHAAHRFHDLAKHAKKDGHMGISIPGPAELNMADLVGWKENIVTRLNKGVEHLLKNAGAELITGWAEFQDAKTVKIGEGKDAIIVQAEHVILANGSVPIELPFMPYDEHVISSREALSLETLPKHVAIVGGGYIGLELGITFRMLGSEVTVVEAMDSVLPIFDKEIRRPLEIQSRNRRSRPILAYLPKVQKPQRMDGFNSTSSIRTKRMRKRCRTSSWTRFSSLLAASQTLHPSHQQALLLTSVVS